MLPRRPQEPLDRIAGLVPVSDYKILLDDPAQQPKLGFEQYARAFAGIIRESEPRFAIGVFGNWGSGKTTLMRAIERRLADDPEVITLWFNAWRYEREEHLIVPMLDTLREALLAWAEANEANTDRHESSTRARRAAATVARAARAILVGLTLRAGLPGGPELALDASKIVADWSQAPLDTAAEPQSFYHASFTALQGSLEGVIGPDVQRIVIFVDDLDRCLPANALQVLESMKLFFDLTGFVFVVGLDRRVVELAIEAKYGAGGPAEAPIKGVDYIKKIFQVPFTLPAISRLQLDEFLGTIAPPQISPAQGEDLRKRVRPHLTHLVADAGVNPREVKRYLNAYTLQRRTRPNLDADVVLCLQTLEFRVEWKDAYDTLLSEREVFTDAVRRQLGGEAAAVENLWPELAAIPGTMLEYLGSPAGRRLLEVPSLDPYLHSVEATRSTQPGLMESYRALGGLRGLLRSFDAAGTSEQRWQLRSDLLKQGKSLLGTVTQMSSGGATALLADVNELIQRSELPRVTGGEASDAELDSWRGAVGDLLARVQAHLRRLRDGTET